MIAQKSEKVLLEQDGKVGIIKLNRAEVMNCLDMETLLQFRTYLEQLRESNVRVIVISGTGKAFCAGMDLKYAKGKSPAEIREINNQGLIKTFSSLYQFPKPTIAMIGGYALGGGTELALSCDFRFASKEHAIFGFPEIDLGILPTWGGLFLPTDTIGLSQAMDLVMTAKKITADEAYKRGLIHEVVPHEKLVDRVMEFARDLARKSNFLLQLAKYVMKQSARADQTKRLELSTLAMELITAGPDGEKRLKDILQEKK
ncbi:MAG: enoyl-CoA hydratase/isomerase family protein [Candidatus Helarchaeota archaeon]|nr:enoyl-CoA hydratase/isomerase family protein [Candidatus Helarchaeota archaeon]